MTLPGRILTLQRQVRELGRLRAGLTVASDKPGGRDRPSSSKTWIATSLNRTYIEAAAEVWGGRAEEWQPLGNRPKEWRVITTRPVIDAILPPGDPLSQAYEMWTGGGCQRRCDGEREQRSDSPCLCVAQFGTNFHEVPVLGQDKKPQRCQINTRLSVFLPELPDIGIWRVETHGYWPSVHITGYVETIKALVGEQVMVPITMGIDPKTRVKDGKTSHYIEIVVALKERASFGQILAAPQALAIGGPADARVVEAGPARAAIESVPAAEAEPHVTDWPAWFAEATSMEQMRAMWTDCGKAGALTPENKAAWIARGKEIRGEVADAPAEAPATPAPVADGEVEPDKDDMWASTLRLAGDRDWSTPQTREAFREYVGKNPEDATGWEIESFRDSLKTAAVPA